MFSWKVPGALVIFAAIAPSQALAQAPSEQLNPSEFRAESEAPAAPGDNSLPAVVVTSDEEEERKAKSKAAKKTKSAGSAKKPPAAAKKAAPPTDEPTDAPAAFAEGNGSESASNGNSNLNSGGVNGYLATTTSSATKTNTPLRNVPQSISVITEQQIQDQNAKSIGDVTKYVPGVIMGQGEGNRDQPTIRGQGTTADFYIDGVRDDAQIFRDLYNTERIEILKGPNALIFGRGGAGGAINRVTKQADGSHIGEATVTGGMYDFKRTSIDVGDAITPDAAFRLTAVYEDSESYRDFVDLERWGINPTLAFRIDNQTQVRVGYEHYFDHRTADRGIPSFNGRPAPTSRSTFFGNPDVSYSEATVDSAFATIEHKTDYGLKIRNHTYFANYDKFYQNVFASGPANLAADTVQLQAYNQENDRQNIFNQTDLTYKFDLGWSRHTLLGGMEFGHQKSRNYRQNGFFQSPPSGGACSSIVVSGVTSTCTTSFSHPTIFTPDILFQGVSSQANNDVTASSRSFYIQDQMEITRYLEIIGGVRHETFDLDLFDRNTSTTLKQNDDLVSPRAGVVLKPTDSLSIYGSYAVSYLPASGDQFSAVNSATVNLDPEKFTNYEVGVKWDVTADLAFTAAGYQLTRTNVRFQQPDGTFVQTGETEVKGFEAGLVGYLTDAWQISAGYGHQVGKVTKATATTAPAGTPLPLLPSDTFSLWNRYQFTKAFGAGFGIVHRTDMLAQLSTTEVVLPSFTTVDAAVFWKINDNLRAQVNVENIFNEGYYISAHNNNNITPGAPTTAYVSLTSNF